MTLVKDIVAKWNKDHPNIQVKATKFDGAAQDMIKKLETDVKAGNAPDLAQVGYAEVPEVFTKGLLEDVTEEAAKYKSDFAEGPYSMMQVDGKTYGLPQDTGPLVYFYNQKAFDELGIKVPKTKDELIEAAKTAAASGKYIMDYEAELDRLQKEKKKLEGEVKRVKGKLSNEGFVSKAPQKVVEEEKAKQVKYEEMLAKVCDRLAIVEKKVK